VEDDGGRLVLQSHCGVTASDRLEVATQCRQPGRGGIVAQSRPDTTAAVTPPSAAAARKASRPPGTALP